MSHTVTQSLTGSLTHSLIQSLTQWLTHSLTFLRNHWCTYLHLHTYLLTHLFTLCLKHVVYMTYLFACLVAYLLTHSLTPSLTHSLTYLLSQPSTEWNSPAFTYSLRLWSTCSPNWRMDVIYLQYILICLTRSISDGIQYLDHNHNNIPPHNISLMARMLSLPLSVVLLTRLPTLLLSDMLRHSVIRSLTQLINHNSYLLFTSLPDSSHT